MKTATRLQALAERLYMLTTLHLELDQQTSARFAETGRQITGLARIVETEHESIKALERIATAHEQRLDDREGQ
jgi:SET domain-containing protein